MTRLVGYIICAENYTEVIFITFKALSFNQGLLKVRFISVRGKIKINMIGLRYLVEPAGFVAYCIIN